MALKMVIPARNEAPYIQGTIQCLTRSLGGLKTDWQIIVADNGSTDGTSNAVSVFNIQNSIFNIRLLSCPMEGKGAAIKYAADQLFATHNEQLKASEGAMDDFFGFIDADLSADPDAIPDMLEYLEADKADVVIASRLLNTKTTNRGWLRTVSSRIFNLISNLILDLDVKDAQCGLKLMNTKGVEVLRDCREDVWFLDIEFLARCRRRGLRVMEVPVVWIEYRFLGRKSQIKHFSDGVQAFKAMLRIRKRLRS